MQNEHGSGRPVTDFTPYCEGDVEPTLNKRIHTLIDCTPSHIVYVDDDFFLEWAFIGSQGEFPQGFDKIANRIGHLETISVTQLSRVQREVFSRLLAEAMARTLGDRDEEKAQAVLDIGEAYLNARGAENARWWYLQGVFAAALPALVMAGLLSAVRTRVGDLALLDILEISLAAAMGGLGALLSIASRTEAIHLEPVAGPLIHRKEGATRVVVGIAGALFVAIAIKANLILGVFSSLTHPFLGLIAACIVAGASERLVPGLIDNMGKSISLKRKQSGK
jgi:hypothetical protein